MAYSHQKVTESDEFNLPSRAPGLGMQGSDFKIPVDDYFRVKTFDPPWNVCNSSASVATELAPWLNKWAGAQAQEDELVIYGFSVGADLLLEMLLTTTSPFLILPQKTLLDTS